MCHRITERTPLAVWILYHCQLSSAVYLSNFVKSHFYFWQNILCHLNSVNTIWMSITLCILLQLLSPPPDSGLGGMLLLDWGRYTLTQDVVTAGFSPLLGPLRVSSGRDRGRDQGVRHRHRGTLGWHGGRGRHETCCHTDYCAPLLQRDHKESTDPNHGPFNGHLLLPLDNKEISGSLRDMMMSWVFIPNDALSDNDWWMSHNLNCVILGVQCPPPPDVTGVEWALLPLRVIHHLLSPVTLWLTITQPSLDTIQSVLQIPL